MQVQPWTVPERPHTVRGIPLEPGERVIFYRHERAIGTRIGMFFLGLFLVTILIGFVFLWAAFTDQSTTNIITTKRIIQIEKGKDVHVIFHGQVREVQRVFKRGLKDLRLHANDNQTMSIYVRDEPELSETILRYVENPSLANTAPSVPFDP